MKLKTLALLGLATAISTGAAGYQLMQSAGQVRSAITQRPALPDLKHQLDRVAEIKIHTPEVTLTLKRTESGWGAVERNMYPADGEKIRKLLLDLTALQLVEAKTADPDRYGRLSLGTPGAEGALSKAVVLTSADGVTLADLVVGKKKFSLLSSGRDGTYIRFKDDPQSWLALGVVGAGEGAEDWLVKEVIDIDPSSVQSMTVTPASGEGFTLSRADAETDEMSLEGLSPSEQVADQNALGDAKGSLSRLHLDDVAPADGFDWPEGTGGAEITTFEGLKITLRYADTGQRSWISLKAEPLSEAARKRAEEINALTSGWVYNIPSWKARMFKTSRSDLVGQAGAPAPDVPETGGRNPLFNPQTTR